MTEKYYLHFSGLPTVNNDIIETLFILIKLNMGSNAAVIVCKAEIGVSQGGPAKVRVLTLTMKIQRLILE